MREGKRRGTGRRRMFGDEEPDLFDQRLNEAVKLAFAGNGESPSATVEPVIAAPPHDAPPVQPETYQAAPTLAPEPDIILPPPIPETEILPKPTPASEPLPARMLNEFVYCPRLFYYEHIEGVFVENADTLRGAAIHKKVDKGTGAMPAAKVKKSDTPAETSASEPTSDKPTPADKPETIHSRSAMLGSDRLGVLAKLDLVEITSPGQEPKEGAPDTQELLTRLEVAPVDYKAGAPREGEDGNDLWPTDRMQLGLQMLILRDNGYQCDRGLIYYRATRQRVPLDWSPELESWIVEQIAEARRVMTGPIPPPLEGSPKCVRCSLNSVCLPDETRLLTTSPSDPEIREKLPLPSNGTSPRRLIAARDDTRVLYLNKPGLRVGRKDEVLQVKDEDKLVDEIRIGDLTHVALFGNIQISTQAVQILCEKEVPITYFSMGGWFYGITRGHELKNIFTRMEQFRLARDPATCLAIARRMVHGKIRNHRTMLMRLHLEPPAPIVAKLKTMAESALEATSLEELLGTEGAAAHFYFSAFAGMLKTEDEFTDENGAPGPQLAFNFSGRNRRPPTDPVNALLSLAYSLLAKDCTLAAMAVGLDPYVGFYHQPRFGRPALALDVMEEFRPLIAESAVLTAINTRMILPKHFIQAGQAVNLSPAGRKIFFQAYEQRMSSIITHPIFDYKVSYRRVLELQFRLLSRYLTGEIHEYPPFLTR